MNIEQLPPTVKAFIGYRPYTQPGFDYIAAYKNGMAMEKIAVGMGETTQDAHKAINKLIETNVITKRESPKHLKAEIKAKAILKINNGASQAQAVEWIKQQTGHKPSTDLIRKWRSQQAVINALQTLEQQQETQH
ncbi:hypothetical protein [Thiomicrorhabdus lithotrophica]|uniref:Uncharacterized protein n=1 Tax=Thiomicrorhabdus lithotrophica TaxID=2949997 RepID=A0ABY8CBJ1_9GAMM|nr:hypothetical protein [Thiomicrorhabdus lithotrophica]WEJ62182.1 hypothetical protein NR989_09190 [Thiomicrorhabdus lithotrophica]